MKSPMLLTFVLTFICCFDIYDGAGNDEKATVQENREIVADQVFKLLTLYGENVDRKKILESQKETHDTMRETKQCAELEIEEYAKNERIAEYNRCILNAKHNLIDVTAEVMWEFDNHTRSVEPKYLDSIPGAIGMGTTLIGRYDTFLLEGGDTELRYALSSEFWKFQSKCNEVMKAIRTTEPVDHSEIERKAAMLIQHQRNEAQTIITTAKWCITKEQMINYVHG